VHVHFALAVAARPQQPAWEWLGRQVRYIYLYIYIHIYIHIYEYKNKNI